MKKEKGKRTRFLIKYRKSGNENLGLEYHIEQIIQTYTTVKMKHAHSMDKTTILTLILPRSRT